MKSYIHLLPTRLSNAAYRALNEELAWPQLEALEVIDLLSTHEIAILGGEVWIPTIPGPTLPPPNLYVWDAGKKFDNEEWRNYVERTRGLAKNFITSFSWRTEDHGRYHLPPYFNLTICDEREYLILAEQLDLMKQSEDDHKG